MIAGGDVTAANVMRLFPAPPRLLALGEPTHGDNVLLEVRNQLFRQFVEQEVYATIAVESDCLTGLLVDEYVTSGAGTLEDVVARGFSHGWGAYGGNRDLVRWMRAHNEHRPEAARVRFAGFDGPLEITAAASPRQSLTALHDYLTDGAGAAQLPCDAGTLERLLGPDGRWTNPAAMRDPSQSAGRTAEAKQLRLLADDLVAMLEAHLPQLAAASTPEQLQRAALHGRTAVGLLRYHHAMADTSPLRLQRLVSARDAMMAANLLALAERGPVFVHAHNAHLQRARSSMVMGGEPLTWWSAGAIVSARLGGDYAHLATALGTLHEHGVGAPPPDTLEGLLTSLPRDRVVLDPRELAGEAPATRVSPWFGYAPLDPAHLAGIDGIVFVTQV